MIPYHTIPYHTILITIFSNILITGVPSKHFSKICQHTCMFNHMSSVCTDDVKTSLKKTFNLICLNTLSLPWFTTRCQRQAYIFIRDYIGMSTVICKHYICKLLDICRQK